MTAITKPNWRSWTPTAPRCWRWPRSAHRRPQRRLTGCHHLRRHAQARARFVAMGGLASAGKFHVLAGAPGQGKTTLALAIMALITNGGRWPDGSHRPAGNVLMWSGG